MPWKRMKLRGARVFARCNEQGALLEQGGRVEVRYRSGDSRAYRASVANLSGVHGADILPDSHCADAPFVNATSNEAVRKRPSSSTSNPPTRPSSEAEVLAYADGACTGNPGPSGLGVVLLMDGRRYELSEYLGSGTNNIAELTGILRAAQRVEDPSRPVRIYTDSRYSIGVLTLGWRARANQALVSSVRDELGRFEDLELIHVRGHAGFELNERADELARGAIERGASTGWVEVPEPA